MPKNLSKILLFLFSLLFLCFFALFVSGSFEKIFQEADLKLLQVYFLDVGQGDATLIVTPKKQTILIDGGPDAQIVYQLGKILPFYQLKIDYVILTHPHSDHVAGLVDVLQKYEIGEIYYTGVVHTTPDFLEWLNLIKEKHIKLNIVAGPGELSLLENNLRFEFLYPDSDLSGQRVENSNNTSIVSKLTYGQNIFLFMGDAETEGEEKLLSQNLSLKADVLKIGHHGSTSSSSEEFLEAVLPSYGVIFAGLDNKFSHPHLRTLKKLERLNINILRTDTDGTIKMQSDGKQIEFLK